MTEYSKLIAICAQRHSLDPWLMEALVLTESSGRADAFRFEPAFYDRYLKGKAEWADQIPRRVSSSYGLMQIMYPVAKELGFNGEPEMLFVPSVNLTWGCLKFSQLLGWAAGDENRALCAYNGGKVGNVAAPFRNQSYADKVFTHRKRLG